VIVFDLAASTGSDPGLDLASLLILGFTALAAAVAAVAAFRTASATRDVVEVSRQSALLTTVPLLVPWVDKETGRIQVDNRGASASHVLRWIVMSEVIGSESAVEMVEVASGSDLKVIRPVVEVNRGRDVKLSGDERTSISELATQRKTGFLVECRYQASWGQEFITTRVYPAGSSESRITITDKQAHELKLEATPRRGFNLFFWR